MTEADQKKIEYRLNAMESLIESLKSSPEWGELRWKVTAEMAIEKLTDALTDARGIVARDIREAPLA